MMLNRYNIINTFLTKYRYHSVGNLKVPSAQLGQPNK